MYLYLHINGKPGIFKFCKPPPSPLPFVPPPLGDWENRPRECPDGIVFRVPFRDAVFVSFGAGLGGDLHCFFLLFLALRRDSVEAAFLKDVPGEIVDFEGSHVQESL